MKTFTSLLLLAATNVAPSSSAAVRGSVVKLQERPNRRRRLQESTCTLVKHCTTFGPDDEHPHGYHKDTWSCQLSSEEAEKYDVSESITIDETSASLITGLENATSTESVLSFSEAVVTSEDEPMMYIPENAQVEVIAVENPMAENANNRAHGVKKAIVIRLIDSEDRAPSASVSKLVNDVFTDAASLNTQMDACSYGKLKIEPFKGKTPSGYNVQNGVVNVKYNVDITTTNMGGEGQAAAAATQLLGNLNDSRFDFVLFCFPAGSKSTWFASGAVNGKYTWYNEGWCSSSAGLMHEVGHNLGLGHSAELGQGEYGDTTGSMGASSGADDTKACFNPQKSYQLGWYNDKVKTINPLKGKKVREFVLNGVADYKKNDDALVVLRLEQDSGQDYYIGFNHAVGINQDTQEHKNHVTVVRKEYGAPDKWGLSTKVASLKLGTYHRIENFNGKGKAVQIVFLAQKNGNATIRIVDGNEDPFPPVGNCKKVTVEFKTDLWPGDSSWEVSDKDSGQAVASSPEYKDQNKLFKQEICLPMKSSGPTNYKFTFYDGHGDGICCWHGQGYYKAKDENGNVLFEGGEDFSEVTHIVTVPKDNQGGGNNGDYNDNNIKPNKKCRNLKQGRFDIKPGGNRRNCKQWAKSRGGCDKQNQNGKYVWQLCRKSCDRCKT